MSQCPKCGAFSFIDMDGNAVIQEAEENAPAGGAAAPPDFNDPIESVIDVPDSAPSFDPFEPMESASPMSPVSPDSEPGSHAQSMGDSSNDFSFGELPQAEPVPLDDFQPIEESVVTEPPTSASYNAGPKPAPKVDQALGPAGDPLNLNDFANSELSAAKDGPLLFRVLISGIDTREIRDSIREVLEDPRFAWDSNEIFSKISKGILTINGLSPVKASILITRIKRLPVQIRWEQYAIAQGQP